MWQSDVITLEQLNASVTAKYRRSFVWVPVHERASAGEGLLLWVLVPFEYQDVQFHWYKSRDKEDMRELIVARRGSMVLTQEVVPLIAMVVLDWEIDQGALRTSDVKDGVHPVYGQVFLESEWVSDASGVQVVSAKGRGVEVAKRKRITSDWGFAYAEKDGFAHDTGVALSWNYGFSPYHVPEEWGMVECAVFYVTEFTNGALVIEADDPLDGFSINVYARYRSDYKGKGALKHKDVIDKFWDWYWKTGRNEELAESEQGV